MLEWSPGSPPVCPIRTKYKSGILDLAGHIKAQLTNGSFDFVTLQVMDHNIQMPYE